MSVVMMPSSSAEFLSSMVLEEIGSGTENTPLASVPAGAPSSSCYPSGAGVSSISPGPPSSSVSSAMTAGSGPTIVS